MSVPGFFTNLPAFNLPHPSVPLRLILTTHLALARALELLRSEPPSGFVLFTAEEDEITRQLQWIMENRLLRTGEVRGFNKRRFKNVIRAPEVTNVDGNHPAKKPDLVFFLQREKLPVLRSHHGIFAECKPVDARHSVGVHYCDKGIVRFVSGEYAWTMQEAMMVAYVRGRRSVASDLAPQLASAARSAALGFPTAPTAVPASFCSNAVERLQVTVHQRHFVWPAGHGNACEIRIFHAWHDCS